jgi:quinoprotein relay system zinc metallohydrolase 2
MARSTVSDENEPSSSHRISRRLLLQGFAALPCAHKAWAGGGALPVKEIAPGVFVHHAPYEEASATNQAGIANLGFIVGDDAVAIVDSGGSLLEGEALLGAIRQITDRPVTYVVNTHCHPDHIFGNGAFPGAKVVGHKRLAAALAARGAYYLETLKRDLGAAAAGSVVVPPDLEVADQMTLTLGSRQLHLQAWPTAHTDCDLTLRDLTTDNWFLGDLLFSQRMPTIDGSLRGWITLLNHLRTISAAQVIPGHGPASAPWPTTSEPLLRYLTDLAREVRAALKKGTTLEEATDTVGRDLKADWALFESVHPRNVAVAYAELEWE